MSDVRIRYQTLEFDGVDIHVRTLRDKQQYSDDEGVASELGISSATWPLFGVIWASGEVLARLMFEYEIEGKRILEVGCGIGLASLVLNQRMADVTATDYHPEAERFLQENVKLNHGKDIPFVRTGWNDKADNSLGSFDLIIGSDLLYEKEHVDWLSGFIEQHARAHCNVVIVDPGRGNRARFRKKMVEMGYAYSESRTEHTEQLTQAFNGLILQFKR